MAKRRSVAMRKIWFVAAALPLVAAGVAVMTPLRAADHLDGKLGVDDVTLDSASDVTDVYAFTPTNRQGRVALIMNVGPNTGLTKFSDKVKYTFEVRAFVPGTGFDVATKLDISCQSDAAGANMTCTGPNGLTKTQAVDTPGTCDVNTPLCLFFGKRSDPFFFDFLAFKGGDGGGPPPFCKGADGGATSGNFFDKKNVSSIILEVDVKTLTGVDGAAGVPILGVAASTNRIGN
jgi:hypothetical protein